RLSSSSAPVTAPVRIDPDVSLSGRHVASTRCTPPVPVTPYTPYTKAQSDDASALVNIRSLFEEDVIHQLCSRLSHLSSADRAEGLATLLGVCVEFGLEAHSPPVLRLTTECLQLLSSSRDIGVAQLCHLGTVACALESRQSTMVTGVLDSLEAAVEGSRVSPSEAVSVYQLLTLVCETGSQQQRALLSSLHTHTQRLVHRLGAKHVTDILHSLLRLQQKQAISLVLRLSHRTSRVFKTLSDDQITTVLSALTILGQPDKDLLAAMEKHLPERLSKCDPELISAVMEYCLQMKCRSETLFEAVAENFVCRAETHTTVQIAKQIVAMGRLNYLPVCSNEMFEKLESILSTRFSHFQPHVLIDVLHACIHLERFPLNYMPKIFSPCFLHTLQGMYSSKTFGQLSQLHLSFSLECTHYWGPRFPFFFRVKRFPSVDEAFETPMDFMLYKQVKEPLLQLLGGNYFSTKIFTHNGYTIDVEMCLDENGLVLPFSQWSHTHKRVALCLDGQNRFCNNTRHLLGKEVTKRRHLHRMGYEVVQIPYFEFEKLRTERAQVQYLQDKLFPKISKFSE
uniref:FAST kinase domain-containing protein 3, mitochondrial-like n=1 Tax=Gouania willdenowi TaxID=441366 RepID=A0A8C5D439_GOUWI